MYGGPEIGEMVGKTFVRVENREGDRLLFIDADGGGYDFYHESDCCESVTIEDINGNLDDLVGSPILLAEESTSDQNPPDAKPETIEYQESFTWTFYKFATVKGHVTVRWYGESNGYYSESVDLCHIPAGTY